MNLRLKKKPSFVLDVGNVNIMDKKVNTNQQVCLKMIRTLLEKKLLVAQI